MYDVPHRFTYDDYERCLEVVDAVYICTPNSEHADYAMRAARAGVHVLCEKPLAVTTSQCWRMIRACRAGGVKLMTAYRLHFEPLTLEIVNLVRRGRIGDPRFFSSSFSMHATPGGVRTRRDTGGGSVYIVGTRGDVNAEPAYEYAEALGYSLTVESKTTKKKGKKLDQFAAELLYFADCVLADRDPEPSGEEGARDVRIVEAIYEAAQSGRAVELVRPESEPQPETAQAIATPPVAEPELVDIERPHK
jgi:glucose-fructose oxidoreductase